jgi:hypothetical protein
MMKMTIKKIACITSGCVHKPEHRLGHGIREVGLVGGVVNDRHTQHVVIAQRLPICVV